MTTPASPFALRPDAPLWVFGYGSLMWDPEFPVAETRIACAAGWRRSFCMWSIHYRGTVEAPGLVLALDRDPMASCEGLALRVTPGAEAETLARLRARELVSSAYLEVEVPLTLRGGGEVQALTYVVDPDHSQYSGALDPARQAEIILQARGGRGLNRDYLWSTVDQLDALGIADDDLRGLAARVRALAEG